MNIVIAGGPRTGKTTKSNDMGIAKVLHTDDLIGKLDWSAGSAAVATWFDRQGPWVIEGVAVPRALRKWLASAPVMAKPCDVAIWLDRPYAALTTAQAAMTKGCLSVWREVLPELKRRGVRIQ